MLKIIGIFKILALITTRTDNIKVVENNNLKLNLSKFKKIKINKFKDLTKSKTLTILINIRVIGFLTFKTKVVFTKLKQIFTKAFIF